MSHQDIASPSLRGFRKEGVEFFPAARKSTAVNPLPFVGSQSYWNSRTISLCWRSIYSCSQDEFPREWIKALDLSNRKLCSLVLTTLCFLFFAVVSTQGPILPPALAFIARTRAADLDHHASNSTPLADFQVSPPINVPSDADCKVTIMEHSFGNSYGAPFVGE